MSSRQLNVLLRVGQILALTPGYADRKATFLNKMHTLVIATVITAGVAVAFVFRYSYYFGDLELSRVVQMAVDVFLYLLNMITLLIALKKRPLWHRLLTILRRTRYAKKVPWLKTTFLLASVWYFGIQILETCVFVNFENSFYEKYAIEYLQLYMLSFVLFLYYFVLRMLKLRYQCITTIILNQLHFVKKLQKRDFRRHFALVSLYRAKQDILVLKEAVDIFNKLFGWPFLCIVMFASLQVLLYLTEILLYGLPNITFVTAVFFFSWSIFWTFLNMWSCDLVSFEVEKILLGAHNLEKFFLHQDKKEVEELQKFVTVVKDNFPIFSAARFFTICRGSIFSFFYAIVTFLVIMMQFEMSEQDRGFDCKVNCNCNGTRRQ